MLSAHTDFSSKLVSSSLRAERHWGCCSNDTSHSIKRGNNCATENQHLSEHAEVGMPDSPVTSEHTQADATALGQECSSRAAIPSSGSLKWNIRWLKTKTAVWILSSFPSFPHPRRGSKTQERFCSQSYFQGTAQLVHSESLDTAH